MSDRCYRIMLVEPDAELLGDARRVARDAL